MLVHLSLSLKILGCQSIVGVFENLHRPSIEVCEQVRRRGIPVEVIRCRGKFDWSVVSTIRDCIKARKIDLIHTHGYKSNVYGYIAARPLGIPLIATCHNWPGKTVPLRLYYRLDQVVLRRFDRVAAVSERVEQSLRRAGIPAGKTCVIENGIDVSGFANSESSRGRDPEHSFRMRVGVVGRLASEKGIGILLRAAREILKSCPETEFVLVGDGPERENLESLARELGIDKEVVFAGFRSDMPGVYASLHVFVLASLNEGMPMALLEAMAAGKPIVATRVGAIPRLVIPEQTGLLVEPGDVTALQGAILRLLRDPDFRWKLGCAGRRFITEHFSADAMAHRYLSLYREMTDNRAAA